MGKLSDKKKKQIIAEYVECENYSAVARKFKVSRTTVKNVVLSDPNCAKSCAKKKEQNAQDILAYMDAKKDIVCDFIDLYFKYLTDPAKLDAATLSQIGTVLGIVIDKFTQAGREKTDDGAILRLIEGMKDVEK